MNIEHWMNNLNKAYIYSVGITSAIVIPALLLIDCFVPILGRSPNAKRKRSKQIEKSEEESKKQK